MLQNRKRPPPRIDRLDWDLLRVYLAVARHGQMAGAAERLGLDISTVSRRLDKLEAELGVVLFERAKSGTSITAAGEKLLPAAEEMERALGDLGVALDAVEAEAEGVVRVTAPPGLLEEFVAPRLVELARLHPKVRVELDASVGYADLTRGEADVALRVRRPDRGDLVSRKLVSVRSLPLGAPKLVEALGPMKRTDQAPWIAWGHDLAQIPESRWMTQHVTSPPILRTSSFGSQLNAAAAGLGLCVVPEVYAHPHGLVPVRPSRALAPAFAELPVADLWLVGHVALRRVPRVEAVWDFLIAELTQPWPALA